MLDTDEVTGSNPVAPTTTKRPLTCGNADRGLFSLVTSGQLQGPLRD